MILSSAYDTRSQGIDEDKMIMGLSDVTGNKNAFFQ